MKLLPLLIIMFVFLTFAGTNEITSGTIASVTSYRINAGTPTGNSTIAAIGIRGSASTNITSCTTPVTGQISYVYIVGDNSNSKSMLATALSAFNSGNQKVTIGYICNGSTLEMNYIAIEQ